MKKATARRNARAVLGLGAALCVPLAAQAEVASPSGANRNIVPLPPSGATDALARQMAVSDAGKTEVGRGAASRDWPLSDEAAMFAEPVR